MSETIGLAIYIERIVLTWFVKFVAERKISCFLIIVLSFTNDYCVGLNGLQWHLRGVLCRRAKQKVSCLNESTVYMLACDDRYGYVREAKGSVRSEKYIIL